jgi:hypothetical protein
MVCPGLLPKYGSTQQCGVHSWPPSNALRRVIMKEMLKADSEPPTLTSLYDKEINKDGEQIGSH